MKRSLVATATVVAGVVVASPAFAPPAGADDQYVGFYSPSRNINCELDYQRAGIPDSTFCLSDEPMQSVTMDVNGALTLCDGMKCMANAPPGIPVLAYGQSMVRGPFTCRSETSGVTCTVVSGRGFTISSSGITSVG